MRAEPAETAAPQAERVYPALTNGLRFYDVLKLWGSPDSKESDRSGSQDVWIYGQGRVIFLRGRVAAWIVPAGSGSTPAPAQNPRTSFTSRSMQLEDPDKSDRKMQELLGEIMQELPKQ